MRFYHPEPPRPANRQIHPVFIPFAGCPERCVFCAQNLQSGQETTPAEYLIESAFKQLENLPPLKFRGGFQTNPPPELAFYGGTFTALPVAVQEALLAEAGRLKNLGLVSRVRCSTRPDAITPEILQRLRTYSIGNHHDSRVLDDIEIGVQSFCREPLDASRRNYSGETAVRACRLVRENGFGLGIQLMPGMPGMSAAHFKRDVEICAGLEPDTSRLYPCLVLAGTRLAELWQAEDFLPWSLEEVLEHLPPAMLALWKRGIRIIRIGLAPQPELETAILAGPSHPALGQRLRSLALFEFLSEKISQFDQLNPPVQLNKAEQPALNISLYVPKRYQGELFGHGGELNERYAALGLTPDRIVWWDKEYFSLGNKQL
ncbi:MAG: radical SAM protein [Deltaproteobacteria bacterium]|jgi:histone acetyltransferase (RNA polymerase elongator complex component)|nr:radical SAM protein [Deltaproteobacteria bacterium]